jgi:branched-chain amino acid transport system substrate-binding protein
MRPLAVPLALTLSLLAGGCSGDGGSATDDAARPSPSRDDPASPTVGAAEPGCQGRSDGVLRIGGLLPQTGSWAGVGRTQRAAAQLAVRDVNDAGGVLGQQVVFTVGDEGADTGGGDIADIARRTVDGQLEAGVDVVLGATSETASLSVIDRVTDACVIELSPSNTSIEFTAYDDDDLYFRTAPSNALQGQALAELMLEDQSRTAAIVGVDRQYGHELREVTAPPFEAGGGQVVLDQAYDPTDDDFSGIVDDIVEADPDALVLAGFDETGAVLSSLFDRGFTPDRKHIYLTDSNMSDATGEALGDAGALAGIKGTVPGAQPTNELTGRLRFLVDPELSAFSYAPETYDAVVVAALAAELAGTDDPAAVARQINGVTRDGEPCSSFGQCKLMAAGGADIAYIGASGPLGFSRAGEPTLGSFAVLGFGADNRIDENLTRFLRVQQATADQPSDQAGQTGGQPTPTASSTSSSVPTTPVTNGPNSA